MRSRGRGSAALGSLAVFPGLHGAWWLLVAVDLESRALGRRHAVGVWVLRLLEECEQLVLDRIGIEAVLERLGRVGRLDQCWPGCDDCWWSDVDNGWSGVGIGWNDVGGGWSVVGGGRE